MTTLEKLDQESQVDHRDEVTELASPRHPDAVELLAYWRERVADGGFVMGRDIPARRIAKLLRSLSVSEMLPDGSDMRVRLAGLMMRRRFDEDIAGRLVSELFPPQDFQLHQRVSAQVLRSDIPANFISRVTRDGVLSMYNEVLLLPIQSPDRSAKWLLAGVFFFDD